MATNEPIAEQLRRAIERSGKTRYRISMESGISQAVLSRFVNRQRELSLANADALCEALGLRVMLIPKDKSGAKKPQKGK
jgi:transcriptional regulator with XRE-family HTH domain